MDESETKAKSEFKGIITKVSGRASTFLTEEGQLELSTKEPQLSGSMVWVFGTREGERINATAVMPLDDDEAAELFKRIAASVERGVPVAEPELLVNDALTARLKPFIRDAARKMLAAKAMNRFIFLRFHGDADGISGALALNPLLRARSCQQNAAPYTPGDALHDVQMLHHEFRPLAVFVDFGSGIESEEGLGILKAGGVEILIIDHHPPGRNVREFAGLFVSPWLFSDGKDVSDYSAGYLAVEVARAAGIADAEGEGAGKLSKLARSACAGDKSEILPLAEEDRNLALVMDFMVSQSPKFAPIDFYSKVAGDPDFFQSMLFQAKERIEEASAAAMRVLKDKDVKGVRVVLANLESVIEKKTFPGKGKVTTYIFERLNSASPGQPMLMLGYDDRMVLFRMNDAAAARGLSAERIVAEVKKIMPDFVDSGGGHAKAAALKMTGGYSKRAIQEILQIVEKLAVK